MWITPSFVLGALELFSTEITYFAFVEPKSSSLAPVPLKRWFSTCFPHSLHTQKPGIASLWLLKTIFTRHFHGIEFKFLLLKRVHDDDDLSIDNIYSFIKK